MELLVERSDGVTHFILNRPDAYNAIDAALRDQLLGALAAAESDGTTCIVLRGQGRGFCAGMDLRAGGANRGVDLAQAMARSSSQWPSVMKVRLLMPPMARFTTLIFAGSK